MILDDTIVAIFKDQVNLMKLKENPDFDASSCIYTQENLDHRNAFICVKKILLKFDEDITE